MDNEISREDYERIEKETDEFVTRTRGNKPKAPEPAKSIVITAAAWIILMISLSVFGDYHVTKSIGFQVGIAAFGLAHYFIPKIAHDRWMKGYYECLFQNIEEEKKKIKHNANQSE